LAGFDQILVRADGRLVRIINRIYGTRIRVAAEFIGNTTQCVAALNGVTGGAGFQVGSNIHSPSPLDGKEVDPTGNGYLGMKRRRNSGQGDSGAVHPTGQGVPGGLKRAVDIIGQFTGLLVCTVYKVR
jgi:hypothetical protein